MNRRVMGACAFVDRLPCHFLFALLFNAFSRIVRLDRDLAVYEC